MGRLEGVGEEQEVSGSGQERKEREMGVLIVVRRGEKHSSLNGVNLSLAIKFCIQLELQTPALPFINPRDANEEGIMEESMAKCECQAMLDAN